MRWWRAHLPIVVAVSLLATAGGAYQNQASDEAADAGSDAGSEESAAAEAENAAEDDLPGDGLSDTEAADDETDDGEEGEEGEEDQDGDESDSDGDDSDSDSDHPGLLIISTDAEANVFVDGRLEGRVEPGEPLEVGVDLGEIKIRASAVDSASAIFEKTIEMEEPDVESVRLRMKKAIRKMRADERKNGVFHDRKTLLMWAKRDNARDVDLRKAYAYCRDLDTGGYDGWRLPTLEELRSLQALWARASYKIIGGILLTDCCMWSSEYDDSGRAWTFDYRFRKEFHTNAGYELGFRALCVREWDPATEAEDRTFGEAEDAADPRLEETVPEAQPVDGASESSSPSAIGAASSPSGI